MEAICASSFDCVHCVDRVHCAWCLSGNDDVGLCRFANNCDGAVVVLRANQCMSVALNTSWNRVTDSLIDTLLPSTSERSPGIYVAIVLAALCCVGILAGLIVGIRLRRNLKHNDGSRPAEDVPDSGMAAVPHRHQIYASATDVEHYCTPPPPHAVVDDDGSAAAVQIYSKVVTNQIVYDSAMAE